MSAAFQARARLDALLAQGRWPQAVVLEGAAEDTAALAWRMAQAAVCTGEGAPPCGACRGCRAAVARRHPDIVCLQGDGTPKSLAVALVRDMRAQAFVRPNEAPRRVFLLLDADCMNVQAQNAMLKILEEPPAGVLFVMTVASRSRLLPTVLSRAMILPLGGEAAAPQTADPLAAAFAQALAARQEIELLALSAGVERDRPAQTALLEELSLTLRDALVLRAGGGDRLSADREGADALGRALTRGQLYGCRQAVEETRARVRQNAAGPLTMTLLCARLMEQATA